MKSISEMRRELAEKAAGDEGFRQSLLADPKAVVARELGVTIPEDFKLQVHEDSGQVAHLILPPSPKLSEAELDRVSGGRKSYSDTILGEGA